MTSSAASDVTLGVVISALATVFTGVGVLVMPVLYFVMQPRTPHFARGIGYGFLAGLALLLGALAVCFVALGGLNPGSH